MAERSDRGSATLFRVGHQEQEGTVIPDPEPFDEATKVSAKDGEVILNGPDGVDLKLTPEAAQETSDRLLEGAAEAAGQRALKGEP